jgi:cytochrome c biogenesis protein CcmG, thiol:disulfide interchange protein DsbE
LPKSNKLCKTNAILAADVAMGTSNKKHHRKRTTPFPWMPVVLGLALIGIAIVALATPGSKSEAADLSSVVPVEVNFAAPELSLQNLEGQTESLSKYRDDIVLVNNWATWCPPCKAEMPTLAAYYNEHAAEGFTIIAIEAGDPLDSVLQFAQALDLKCPVWLDPDGASIRAFGNGTLPNSYVIDRSGIVRYGWTGKLSKAMLEKFVTPLLPGN